MMMTCRLLCVLLVLALCCCLCVCAEELPNATEAGRSEDHQSTPELAESEGDGQPLSPITGAPPDREETAPRALESETQVPTHSDSPSVLLVAEKGKVGEKGPNSDDESVILQEKGNDDTTRPQSNMGLSEEEAAKETAASVQTATTTTTQALTTTTTTQAPSTTTAAPEAPSTTTTEAPTTTTTRAPSRPREIDGSLSSSAWVCAPLLLAASVLAYTALG
ncbi:mucin TcMUCII, putative [Trypanosoma cruzi marinkellei]|uniref:Mucin TcMUCII, putative n=1 Tax=Trypanosoma cruzi marinkellei TaxID=85056 RepID=K2MV60_TRYCR|nr:mucin TcMUCII, putative [Trypanosoma cruzi marinkellei]